MQILRAQSRVTGALRLHGRVGRFDRKRVAEQMFFQNHWFDRGVQDGDEDLWFLDVLSIGRGKPPQKQPSGIGYGSATIAYPEGMPATKVQLLLRKVTWRQGQ